MCVYSYVRIVLCCSCDLDVDLDMMTLIYELDLDIVKMYLHTKMFLGQGFQKLDHGQNRHTKTDRRDRKHYHNCIRRSKKWNKRCPTIAGFVVLTSLAFTRQTRVATWRTRLHYKSTSVRWVAKLSWLENDYSRPLFSAVNCHP